MDAESLLEKEDLLKIARTPMPFGKYEGRPLIDLPEAYLLWFAHRGFPRGNLGRWLALTLEIKIEGLEELVRPLKHRDNPPIPEREDSKHRGS